MSNTNDGEDLAEFLALTAKSTRRRCPVNAARDRLSKKEVAQLEAAIVTHKSIIANNAIAAWLTGRGVDATHQQIISHRRGTCTCYDG